LQVALYKGRRKSFGTAFLRIHQTSTMMKMGQNSDTVGKIWTHFLEIFFTMPFNSYVLTARGTEALIFKPDKCY